MQGSGFWDLGSNDSRVLIWPSAESLGQGHSPVLSGFCVSGFWVLADLGIELSGFKRIDGLGSGTQLVTSGIH